MYVIVQHEVKDPAKFRGKAEEGSLALPPHLKLHHCFPTADGSRAVCVWEADSVRSVEQFFADNELNQMSSNTFFSVENKEGVALPSSMQRV
jgi:hypothetical protein